MNATESKRAELRDMIAYGPPASPRNPNAPIYWTGIPGNVCQACASRLIGRGFGSELRTFGPVYADNAPATDRACLACNASLPGVTR